MNVQGMDGVFYQVDIGDQVICNCYGFQKNNDCDHLRRAKGIYLNRSRFHRYLVMSAYHKEIRRCDVEKTVMWSYAFAALSGSKQPGSYAQKILFEESRNLDLYSKFKRRQIEPMDVIRGITRSRKKWELGYLKNHIEDWFEGFVLYVSNRDKWDAIWVETLIEKVRTFQTPAEAFELYFFMREKKKDPKIVIFFLQCLEERAKQEKNERLLWFLGLGELNQSYEFLVSLELAIGYWEEHANEYHPDIEVNAHYIPRFEDYVYDCHNYQGIQRLLKHWGSIKPGLPTPELARLDLRWSGQLLGIAWRFLCYQQYGSMQAGGVDIPWESVKFPDGLWPKLLLLDGTYYRSFYQKLVAKGYEVTHGY